MDLFFQAPTFRKARRVASALVVVLLGCGESKPPADDDSGGGNPGSGGSAMTGGSSGASATGGSSGTTTGGSSGTTTGGSSGSDPTGGNAGTPTACNRLGAPGPMRELYPLPADATDLKFDPDGAGVLATMVIGDAVRVVSIRSDDTTQELLMETEYTPPWSFEPTRVFAAQDGTGGIDLLVSADSSVGFVRKPYNAPVRAVELAFTNFLDLQALSLAPSGRLSFARGEEMQIVSFLDIDPVLAANPTGTDLTDAVEAELMSAVDAATLTVSSPVPVNGAASRDGAWIAAERMDPAVDCTATGDMVPCGVGAMVGTFDCTFHLDVWQLGDGGFFDMPRGTLDSGLHIIPACGATEPNLRFEAELYEQGIARHHLLTGSTTAPACAVVLQNETDPLNPALRPGVVLIPNGAQAPAGDLTGLPISDPWEDAWITSGDRGTFACSGNRCTTFGDPNRSFDAPALEFAVLGALGRPEGLIVYGRSAGTPSAIVAATLPCLAE